MYLICFFSLFFFCSLQVTKGRKFYGPGKIVMEMHFNTQTNKHILSFYVMTCIEIGIIKPKST